MRNSFFFDCYYKIGVVVFFVRLCCVNGGVREINSNNFYDGWNVLNKNNIKLWIFFCLFLGGKLYSIL